MAASSTIDAAPTWSTVALTLGLLIFIGTVVALFVVKDAATERRIFWSGFLLLAAAVSIAVGYRGWGVAVGVFVAVVIVALVYAYLRTDYVKIGGRTYTASSSKERQ